MSNRLPLKPVFSIPKGMQPQPLGRADIRTIPINRTRNLYTNFTVRQYGGRDPNAPSQNIRVGYPLDPQPQFAHIIFKLKLVG